MSKPLEKIVRSLTEFTKAVETALGESRRRHPGAEYHANWYRGHGEADSFSLKPSLYRHPRIRDLFDLLVLERNMLDDFKRLSFVHDQEGRRADDSPLERLFYMQHYGVPTRLLDWTTNPFIALYFALTDSPASLGGTGKHEDSAVWIMDPVSWNKKAMEDMTHGDKGPCGLGDTDLSTWVPKEKYERSDIKGMYDNAAAILDVSNSTRMVAQRGVFMLFGKSTAPMEKQYDTDHFPRGCLRKLIVKKKDVGRLLASLIDIGYSDSVSYPDLHGVAREIRRTRGFRV